MGAPQPLSGSRLRVRPRYRSAFEAAGILAIEDVLSRAEVVRDLPDRANLVLHLDPLRIHVKRRKRAGRRRRGGQNREVEGLELADRLGIPVPCLVFAGVDAEGGVLTGTQDVAGARPLDDVLRGGALQGAARRDVLEGLAEAVAVLHRARHHHRDLYLNHVWVDAGARPRLRALIDWERQGRHRCLTGRWAVKDLAALLASIPPGTVTARERLAFLARYLARVPVEGRRRRRRLARRVGRKAARIRAHVPRTPVGEGARPKDEEASP
ncbi:MAG: lipopolysaccharide kinase InaA family protein [Planctomycetota bacterium]